MPKMPVRPLNIQQFQKQYNFNAFTSEALRRGQKMENDIEIAHKMRAEEIDAIKQLNSKGFRVFDIDPNQLTRTEYMCVYDQVQIQRFVGVENQYEGGVSRIDNTGSPTANSTVNSYWRTVQFDIPGNFLRIEFLPARIAESNGASSFGLAGAINGNQTNITPQNTDVPTFVTSAAAKRVVLLDFENPSDAPFYVNDGDSFKTSFSKVLITLKQMNVKIRVIIGYNSEIRSEQQPPTNLYLWKGEGFTKNSSSTPSPYCITDADVTTTTYEGVAMGATTQSFALAMPDPVVGTQLQNVGVSVLYINSFTGMAYQKVTTDAIFQCQWELFIANVDTVGTVLSMVKRLAMFSQSHSMIGGANGVGFSTPNHGPNWNEPLRVCLKPGQALAIRLIPLYRSAAFTFYMKFEVSGYVMGRLSGSGLSGTATPFLTQTYYREHPYPQDNDTSYFPRT